MASLTLTFCLRSHNLVAKIRLFYPQTQWPLPLWVTFLELLSLCLALGYCLAFSYLPSGNQSPTLNSSKTLLSTTTFPEATLCLPEFGTGSHSVFPIAMSALVGQVPTAQVCTVTAHHPSWWSLPVAIPLPSSSRQGFGPFSTCPTVLGIPSAGSWLFLVVYN